MVGSRENSHLQPRRRTACWCDTPRTVRLRPGRHAASLKRRGASPAGDDLSRIPVGGCPDEGAWQNNVRHHCRIASRAARLTGRSSRRSTMVPLVVLVIVALLARLAGQLGIVALRNWAAAVRVALAVMLCFTAAAHFNSMRADLIRMVPPAVPNPELMVTFTGVCEILGAIGLLVP